MLKFLSVKNFATVEEIKVELRPGLNILTGETGAGKSVILGSLGLLLGERADSEIIRTGTDSALVESIWEVAGHRQLAETLKALEIPMEENSLTIRREVSAKGTSKALVNDRLATLSTLKEITADLIDLHGQHQHQSLLDTKEHLEFLDQWGKFEKARHTVKELYQEEAQATARLKQARRDRETMGEKRELYQFQLQELKNAGLKKGEEELLLEEKSRLENIERLSQKVGQALTTLEEEEGSALTKLKVANEALRQAAQWDKSLLSMQGRIEEALLNQKDISRELEAYAGKLEYDPARLEIVRERLSLFASLKRKHSKNIEELIVWQEELEQKLETTDTGNQLKELESSVVELRKQYAKAAEELSGKRQVAAPKLEKEITRQLSTLGLEKTLFKVGFEQIENEDSWLVQKGNKIAFDQTGFEQVEFLISPNPGEDLKPLAKIASGGELSRIMLALKSVLAEKDRTPVLVFDEIDSGIGGAVAEAVGRKLKALSRGRQILCITHLQQIASFADWHYKVEKNASKGRTVTTLRLLERRERIEEIARLISGERITPLAQKQASLMIEQATQT